MSIEGTLVTAEFYLKAIEVLVGKFWEKTFKKMFKWINNYRVFYLWNIWAVLNPPEEFIITYRQK